MDTYTELKRAEQAYKEASTKFTNLLRQSPNPRRDPAVKEADEVSKMAYRRVVAAQAAHDKSMRETPSRRPRRGYR